MRRETEWEQGKGCWGEMAGNRMETWGRMEWQETEWKPERGGMPGNRMRRENGRKPNGNRVKVNRTKDANTEAGYGKIHSSRERHGCKKMRREMMVSPE